MGKVSIFNDLLLTQIRQLRTRQTEIYYNTLTNISLLYIVYILFILYNYIVTI